MTTSPLPSPSPPLPFRPSIAISNMSSASLTSFADLQLSKRDEWLRKMRGWLMVVAVLVASITYQAGLNPPGGFWQEDMATYPTSTEETYIRRGGHFAGDPVMRDKSFNRYQTYMAFNTAAFVLALCIIFLLMTESSFHGKLRLRLLRWLVQVHVVFLGVAYYVGCTRDSFDAYFSLLVFSVQILLVVGASLGVHYHYKFQKARQLSAMGHADGASMKGAGPGDGENDDETPF